MGSSDLKFLKTRFQRITLLLPGSRQSLKASVWKSALVCDLAISDRSLPCILISPSESLRIQPGANAVAKEQRSPQSDHCTTSVI
jgi:hypothetical protein